MTNSYRFNDDKIYAVTFSNEQCLKLVNNLLDYQKDHYFEEKQDLISDIKSAEYGLPDVSWKSFEDFNKKAMYHFSWSHKQISILIDFLVNNYEDDDNFRVLMISVLSEANEIE